MQRMFASLLGEESVPEANNTQVTSADQMEALRDLHGTYVHPIQCSHRTNYRKMSEKKNLISILKQRETGLVNLRQYPTARYKLMDRLLPNAGEVIASMTRPTFCGQFSDDGQRFISACQDYCIRLYDTSSSRSFPRLAEIEVDDVGWSILDTALSPYRNYVAYSTWSEFIYLVNLDENQTQPNIIPLRLQPHAHSFSIFSLQFSQDASEIIAGSNDTCVYIYDLEKHKQTLRVEAHKNDVNAVRFIDNSNSLLVSGSDDGLVLIWDRRALNEAQPKPVGVFAGHTSGITFVHSRMDSRYLISNCKDQSIKLWDMRRFSDEATTERSRIISNRINRVWDYRTGSPPGTHQGHKIVGDPSVRTYRGHSVGYTLIRCYFSPSFTSGQRYIVTGSSDGCIYIYDVLTGEIERRLRVRDNDCGEGREKCVRDVSWHPFENYIISTSWDNHRAHIRWSHNSTSTNDLNSSLPIETNVASVQAPSSPSSYHPLGRLATLQRILIEQLLGSEYGIDSDDDTQFDE